VYRKGRLQMYVYLPIFQSTLTLTMSTLICDTHLLLFVYCICTMLTVLNMVINTQVPQNWEYVYSRCVIITFLCKALLHGLIQTVLSIYHHTHTATAWAKNYKHNLALKQLLSPRTIILFLAWYILCHCWSCMIGIRAHNHIK
jgi:hypothetical protein